MDDMPIGLRTRIDVDKAVQDAMALANIDCDVTAVSSRTDPASLKHMIDNPPNDALEADAGVKTKVSTIPRSKLNVIPHFEAGFYCCGFVYYESLATVRRRNIDADVLFTHVPGWRDAERLERGVDAICAIIGAACKQIEARDSRD